MGHISLHGWPLFVAHHWPLSVQINPPANKSSLFASYYIFFLLLLLDDERRRATSCTLWRATALLAVFTYNDCFAFSFLHGLVSKTDVSRMWWTFILFIGNPIWIGALLVQNKGPIHSRTRCVQCNNDRPFLVCLCPIIKPLTCNIVLTCMDNDGG